MSISGKDSPEVVKFMTLFTRLKSLSGDTPENIAKLAETDLEICTQLSLAAYSLRVNERKSRKLFSAPVDPAFIAAWRDYEKRYESILSDFAILGVLPKPGDSETSVVPVVDLVWKWADSQAAEKVEDIEDAINFAQFNVDQEERWSDRPDFIEGIREGIAALSGLKRETGLDLHGVFRRRALVPFVLVPRHVAAKHGGAGALSFLNNLQHAHDAFVFGATHGALALMRSIMEAALRDHYRSNGKNLYELILHASDRLPPRANAAALHRLRKLANAILHLDGEKGEGLSKMDTVQMEKEIVSLLFVLRALIEAAE